MRARYASICSNQIAFNEFDHRTKIWIKNILMSIENRFGSSPKTILPRPQAKLEALATSALSFFPKACLTSLGLLKSQTSPLELLRSRVFDGHCIFEHTFITTERVCMFSLLRRYIFSIFLPSSCIVQGGQNEAM